MKKALKIGGIISLALVLVGAGALFLLRPNQPAAAETSSPTAIVTRGSIEETVSATGNVVADRQATLTFQTSGSIAQVLVEEGQQVKAGQVLARLDTTSLEWQITVAQASLDTAQARLEQVLEPPSDEELASAQAALDQATANYQDVKDGSSEEELASARASLSSAKTSYEDVKDGPSAEELASARAALESARASVAQAQAAYDKVKNAADIQARQESLNLETATIELKKAQANYDDLANHPTESELASAKAQVASAESTLAALLDRPTQAELTSAKAQVASAKATLAGLLERPKAEDVAVYEAQLEEAAVSLAKAEDALDDALIVAPFEGTVLQMQANEGEWASMGAPAIVLAATQPLILDVDVDEVDVAQIAEGQTAHLSFDAVDDAEIAGTVTYIAPSSSDVSGAVAYGIEISFNPDPLPVRLGMTADVEIVVASTHDTLVIPNRAITADRETGRYFVTRQLPDGAIQRLEVRIGLRDGSQTEILEGLNEGDVLVLPEVPGQDQSEEEGFSPPGPGGRLFGGG